MTVFLDTRDLIDLLEDKRPCSVASFEAIIRAHGESIAISFSHLAELAAPFNMGGSDREVTKTLEALDMLTVVFTDELAIPKNELEEAVHAFLAGKEPQTINPFVERLDLTIPYSVVGNRYEDHRPSEIILELHRQQPTLFGSTPRSTKKLREAVAARRSQEIAGGDLKEFSTQLPKLAEACRLDLKGVEVSRFASWLWERPDRSPGVLLWFHVLHAYLKNKTARLKDSDSTDFSWPWLLTYVTYATLDRPMRHYVRTACCQVDVTRCAQIFDSVTGVIGALGATEHIR